MYFVSIWKHGIKFLISQWAIPLVNLSLPAPSLQLFWSHAHQVTCKNVLTLQQLLQITQKTSLLTTIETTNTIGPVPGVGVAMFIAGVPRGVFPGVSRGVEEPI